MRIQLLHNSEQHRAAFEKLMRRYERFYWAVAWAGSGFNEYQLLLKNSHKIAKIVVGTHFYQTHPDFIFNFGCHNGCRFFYNSEAIAGTFHPKVFVFESP